MKKLNHYLFRVLPIMVAAAMFMVSCSSSDEGTFIPKSATSVCHIDVASIWKKGDFANADKLQMMKSLRESLGDISPEGNQMIEAMLKDPSSCGIDFRQPVCFFSEPVAEDLPGIDYSVAVAKIQSRSKFDKFLSDLENVSGEKFKHCDTLGLTSIEIDKGQTLAYNDDRIFFVFNTPDMLYLDLPDLEDKILTSNQYIAKLLNLKKDESMASNKNFAKYLKERKDLSYFMSYGNIMGISANPMNALIQRLYGEKDLEQFKKASVCVYGSFEKGRIEITSKTYGIPEALQKFGNRKFNEDLLAYLPAQTLAAFTVSIDMKALTEYLGAIEDEDISIDEPLGIKDYTIEDLLNALGGSMAATFYGYQEGTPYFAAAIDLTDTQVARDLLNEMAINNGNVYSFDFLSMQLVLTDKVAVLSTDPAVIANAQTGGKSNGLMAIANKAKKGNYFYFDLNLEDWPTELLALIGFDSNPIVSSIFAMLDRLEAETVNNQDGVCNIYLTNDKVNSLAYIFQEVDKLM